MSNKWTAIYTAWGKIKPIHDPYLQLDWDATSMTETNDFTKAAEEVAAFVEDKMVVTVADIVKAMPQHERIVFSLLDTLRMNGRVYWDEWRPLPTLIHAGDRRIPESTYKYDWVGARERTWKHRTQDLEKVGTSGSKELAAA